MTGTELLIGQIIGISFLVIVPLGMCWMLWTVINSKHKSPLEK